MYLKEIKIKGFLFVFWNLVWSILDLAIWKWAQWLLENHRFLNVIWHSQGGEKDRRGGKKRVKITLKPSYGECILLYWAHSENTWCLILFIQALDIACDIFHVFGMTWWVLLCFKNILSHYYIKVKIWWERELILTCEKSGDRLHLKQVENNLWLSALKRKCHLDLCIQLFCLNNSKSHSSFLQKKGLIWLFGGG